jgi:hypothetical protein
MSCTKSVILTACVLTAGAIGIGGLPARQPAAGNPTAAQPAKASEPKTDQPEKGTKPKDKRFTFEMRDQPWSKVFAWYADVSGLAYIGQNKPTGTCTFIPPQGKRQYTLEEITDILNEALLAQKHILIRRPATFTVLPADEMIDPSLLPRVSLDDLEKRGKTELVTVALPLKNLMATDIGPEVKKMLGSFGAVTVLERANQLILQDTAVNLRLIHKTITEIEARPVEKKRDFKIGR